MGFVKGMLGIAFAGAVAAASYAVLSIVQYADVRIFTDDTESGRTKNAVAAVLATEIARGLYSNADFELVVVKNDPYPDAKVKGHIAPDEVEASIDLLFSSVHYTASRGNDSLFEGKVDKSEFDWKVAERPDGSLHITRFGLKWNTSLELRLASGIIHGRYHRTDPTKVFDWKITGTYDGQGKVHALVDVPFGMDIGLEGKIVGK